MDINLGYFKQVFLVDTIYGLTTVSLETLDQSKLKVAYSYLLIAVYMSDLIISFFNFTTGEVIVRVIIQSFSSSLVWAIVDYKSKISAVMNLEAIENTIESNKFTVFGKTWMKANVISMIAVNVALQLVYFIFYGLASKLYITRYLTAFHSMGIQVVLGWTMVMLIAKIVMTQRALTKGFSEIRQNRQVSLNAGNRTIRMQNEINKKWALLSELQGALHTTGNNVRDLFYPHIIWYRVIIEVIGPITFFFAHGQYLNAHLWSSYLRIVIIFLSILLAVKIIENEKEEALWTLIKDRKQEEGRSSRHVKHQILATIHRNRTPFSCGIFDVDYSLLATVLENCIFVYTTMMASFDFQ